MPYRSFVSTDSKIMKNKTKDISEKQFRGKFLLGKVRDVGDTLMACPTGVALAANQIGINLNFFLAVRNMKTEKIDEENLMLMAYFNPEIIEASEEKEVDWEGCLSYPDKSFKIERSKKIKLKYLTFEKTEVIEEFEGLNSIITQHEIDHLNGVRPEDVAIEISDSLEVLEQIKKANLDAFSEKHADECGREKCGDHVFSLVEQEELETGSGLLKVEAE